MSNVAAKPSRIHGRGLFASAVIGARSKIGELTGEIVSQREARRRALGQKAIAIVEFEDGFAVDATHSDSIFRYVNHSCTPNCFMRRFKHHVEFYALKAIEAGDEITCNYGETHHNGALRCKCKSANCRGNL